MKILYHHRTVAKDGMDVHIQELTAALRGRGHEIIMCGPTAAANSEFGSSSGATDIIRKILPRFVTELLEWAYSALAFRRLEAAYLQHKPDIVYERYNLFLMAGARLKKKYKMPFLLEINAPLAEERAAHGGLALKGFAAHLEAKVWKAADYALPVSSPLAEIVVREGVEKERIKIIHNGVNLDRFAARQNGDELRRELGLSDALVLGFTGFMREWHGLERVLHVMAEMKAEADAPPLHFLVVGDGPSRPFLEQEAARLGLQEQITITGVMPRDKVADYVSCFDIALQPMAVSYASPLKLFEYMAIGRPILAPNQDNIKEILEHNKSGLLFEASDPQAFSEGLKMLCRDAGLRERLSKGAREQINSQGFTWDGNAQKIEALAKKLMQH